jgi:hypothetical protein
VPKQTPRDPWAAAAIAAFAIIAARPAWTASDPSPAPPAPPEEQQALPEVTVIAPRPVDARQAAPSNIAIFVRGHGKPGQRIGQLGRWEVAPCVSTDGLTKGLNDFVTARVEAIAATVAPHLTPATTQPCKPNVFVIFTTEPQKLMDNVAKQQPQLLGFHSPGDVPKLKLFNKPVQAWYVTATRGDSGLQLAIDDIWSPSLPPGELGSRLRNGLKSVIMFVLVAVDTNKVDGYTIGSLSDYIAMVTLSQTRLGDTCGELPSVLDLMASQCGADKPDSITAGDVAYLKALYSINMDQEIGQQRVSIEAAMKRQLQAAE